MRVACDCTDRSPRACDRDVFSGTLRRMLAMVSPNVASSVGGYLPNSLAEIWEPQRDFAAGSARACSHTSLHQHGEGRTLHGKPGPSVPKRPRESTFVSSPSFLVSSRAPAHYPLVDPFWRVRWPRVASKWSGQNLYWTEVVKDWRAGERENIMDQTTERADTKER